MVSKNNLCSNSLKGLLGQFTNLEILKPLQLLRVLYE